MAGPPGPATAGETPVEADPVPAGALGGALAVAGVLATDAAPGLAAGAGKDGTLALLVVVLSGTGAGPDPTTTTAATTEITAATPLTDAMVRSRKRCALEAPAATAAAATPADAATAAPATPVDAGAPAASSSGCPNSGDAKTSSRVV
jgi:hypothetical protein